jgi:hypothetical protein
MDNEVLSATRHGPAELRQWYEEYLVAVVPWPPSHAVLKALDQDIVDSEQMEQQIQQNASSLPDFEYFCGVCRTALNNWPKPSTGEGDDRWDDIRISDSISLEAAARRGCRFCCFTLQILIDEGLLQLFRRIEGRLKVLGEYGEFTAFVSRSEVSIGLPGRTDPWRQFYRVAYLDSAGE